MPIIAKDTGTEYRPAPEGLHQGVCVDVVDLGLEKTQWGEKHKVRIMWQIDKHDAETDKRFIVTKKYTISLHEKSNLTRDLESWRGRKFSAEEKSGFDLEKLLGANCQLQIVQNLADSGRTYANVQAVVPIGNGMTKMRGEDYVRIKDREQQNGGSEFEATEEDVPF
jgi:hypothetical protein